MMNHAVTVITIRPLTGMFIYEAMIWPSGFSRIRQSLMQLDAERVIWLLSEGRILRETTHFPE